MQMLGRHLEKHHGTFFPNPNLIIIHDHLPIIFDTHNFCHTESTYITEGTGKGKGKAILLIGHEDL
jgi:hypothetical protein